MYVSVPISEIGSDSMKDRYIFNIGARYRYRIGCENALFQFDLLWTYFLTLSFSFLLTNFNLLKLFTAHLFLKKQLICITTAINHSLILIKVSKYY